jgi:hypothetical protein
MSIVAAVGSRPPTLGHGTIPPDAYLASMTIAGPTSGVATYGVGTYTLAGKDQYGHAYPVTDPTYSSTETDVATINASSGVAAAVAAGTTSIGATAVNGNGDTITASNPISLTIAARAVTTIVLTGPTSVIVTHDTAAYTATAYDQKGGAMTGQTFTFHSATPADATIDSGTGVATGVSAGSSVITATIGAVTSNGVTLTVDAQVPTGTITVSPSSFFVAIGDTQALTGTVYDQGSPANPIVGATIAWSSVDASIASVDSGTGVVTGEATGSTTIDAVDGAASGSSAATVTNTTPTSITVSPSSATVAPGGTQQLTVTDNLGNDVTALCEFTTDDLTIATVDAPALTGLNLSSVDQGYTGDVVLTGTNFRVSGQTVVFTASTGITINSTTVDSDTQITVNITVSGTATPGGRTVEVDDPDHGNSETQPLTITSLTPTLTSATPNSLAQGATSQNIALVGTNFASGQVAQFSNGGITVNSTTINSSTSITANVTVSGSATTGAGTVTVHDGTYGDSNTEVFTVTSSGTPTIPVTAGLVLHLMADVGTSTTTNNTPLSDWTDQSTTGAVVSQATSADQPTYLTNVQNGLPVIQTDGSNDILNSSGAISALAITNLVIFAVFRRVSGSGDAIALSNLNGTNAGFAIGLNSSGIELLYGTGSTATALVTAVGADTSVHQSTFILNQAAPANKQEIRVDGLSANTSGNAYSGATSSPLSVGGLGALGVYYGNFQLAEFAIYDPSINPTILTTDLPTVEAYLKTKWGTP